MSLKRFSILFLAMFLLVSSLASGQRRRPMILIPPVGAQKLSPLQIHTLAIDVKVVGNLAETTMELTFYNPNPRVLEGELYFPLGEGQTVSRFALEVNGKYREAVPVEKTKGREVFETIVREQIDPGLLEMTKGNTFRTRVYPIPANGYKRLLVAYQQELQPEPNGFLFLLPLAFEQRVANFSLRVEVLKQSVKPVLSQENELTNIEFKSWQESYLAQIQHKDYVPNKALGFIVPKTKAYQKVIVTVDPKTDARYFYIHLVPEMFLKKRPVPRRIALFWDASASGEQQDFKKISDLLTRYFQVVSNAQVDLYLFRNRVEPAGRFQIIKGGWQGLQTQLAKVEYDGATQLGEIDFTKVRADLILLVTDGVNTIGKSRIKLSKIPVIGINARSTAEHAYFNSICQKSLGRYVNLAKMSLNEAFSAMTHEPYSFLYATYKGKVQDLVPSIPAPVGRDFSMAGLLKAESATVTLHFGFLNDVKYTIPVTIEAGAGAKHPDLLVKLWAQKRIAELSLDYKANRAAIMALSRRYGLVTPETSLIVLERAADYVRFNISPPEELRAEYFAIIKQQKFQKLKQETDHLEWLVKEITLLKQWWGKTFDWQGKPPQDKKLKLHTLNGSGRGGGGSGYIGRRIAPSMVQRGPSQSEITVDRNLRSDKKKEGKRTARGGIALSKWTPDTPYMKILKATQKGEAYQKYLALKKQYKNSSAFFLDVADFFLELGQKDLALRILTNIAEMELENHKLLRILAHRLVQLKHYPLAIAVFKEVLVLRPDEPQSYRDLGLSYAAQGSYQKGLDHLYRVVRTKWDSRFSDVNLIALVEMNNILARHRGLNFKAIDQRLIHNFDADIRVVLNWDADNTDMDLWVKDPNLEQCDYSHNLTYVGGRMSKDNTSGYGPEEFMLRRAKPGEYQIQVNYYGNNQQILAGATTIQVQLFLNWGRPNQQYKEITLRLKETKEVINVGTFWIKPR